MFKVKKLPTPPTYKSTVVQVQPSQPQLPPLPPYSPPAPPTFRPKISLTVDTASATSKRPQPRPMPVPKPKQQPPVELELHQSHSQPELKPQSKTPPPPQPVVPRQTALLMPPEVSITRPQPSPARSTSFRRPPKVTQKSQKQDKVKPQQKVEPVSSGDRSPPRDPARKLPRLMTVGTTYTPSLSDELPVKIGDIVRLVEEYEDGWCLIQQVGRTDAERGVCPRFCLAERQELVSRNPKGPVIVTFPVSTVSYSVVTYAN